MQTFYRLYNFINLHCIPFIEPLSHLIGSAHLRNGDFEKDGTKDEFQCSLEDTLFSDCMQRFLYVRCYNSSEVTAALKASSLCISQKVTSLFACSYICCSLLPWAVVNKKKQAESYNIWSILYCLLLTYWTSGNNWLDCLWCIIGEH